LEVEQLQEENLHLLLLVELDSLVQSLRDGLRTSPILSAIPFGAACSGMLRVLMFHDVSRLKGDQALAEYASGNTLRSRNTNRASRKPPPDGLCLKDEVLVLGNTLQKVELGKHAPSVQAPREHTPGREKRRHWERLQALGSTTWCYSQEVHGPPCSDTMLETMDCGV